MGAEGRVAELIELVIGLLGDVRDTNTHLSVRLQNALRALYGRRSEKISTSQMVLLLSTLGSEVPPNVADAVKEESSSPEGAKEEPVAGPPAPPPPRGRGGRSPLPSHLPRTSRIVPVPAAERICDACGATKTCIGYRSSDILEFVPGHFTVIEEKREKRACLACPEEGVTTALSEKVMDGGRPGPGLLAHLVVSKGQDSLPIYRQAQQYERCGLRLSPSTLGDWAAFACDVLTPIADRIFERARLSLYFQVDDTGLRVLDRDHPNGVKRGHIWGFVGAPVRLVAFRYSSDWKATRPAALLANFEGDLQGDGYAGYEAMLRDDESGEALVPLARRLGCGMHIRSKFEKAAKGGDARAAIVLAFFKKIYRIEAACKIEGLTDDERKARRDEQSMPVVEEMFQWIHELHPGLVPKSPLYVATRYAMNQEALWRRCFTEGRFEIDNGEVERQLRRIAIGRKNYLFAGSDKGAERLAIVYTVLGSCHMHGVDPLAWATDVIAKLQSGWPQSRLDELLPDVWKKSGTVSVGESMPVNEAHAAVAPPTVTATS
jgi:transposase